MQTKTLTATLQKNATTPKIDATITTETIDRDGEVLVSQGMDASEYEKNPVVFYNHEYDQPIGKITSLRRGDRKIDATIEFAQRPDGFEGSYFPEFVESLVEQDIVKGISVGFVPLAGGVRKASAKDVEDYGDGVRQVFSKWKLLEVSVAPLPANATALVSAVRKGLVDGDDVRRWMDVDPENLGPLEVIRVRVPNRGRLSTLLSSRRADGRKGRADGDRIS
jgi:HK97 family phage prohead protease